MQFYILIEVHLANACPSFPIHRHSKFKLIKQQSFANLRKALAHHPRMQIIL